MKTKHFNTLLAASLLALGLASNTNAAVFVQCPDDKNGDAIPGNKAPANTKCMHLGAGDGFVKMADGKLQYTFGFSNLTGVNPKSAMSAGELAASFPAPTIELEQGQEFYLSLTNVGMLMRPDLADPHTVHFHGFPNASSVFDGVPDASISITAGATLTYYYNVARPGTYMYHCHVEAAEHMQMGMLGNLYVKAGQNQLGEGVDLNGFTHHAGYEYAYNDGDGSTFYDVDYPIQIGSFDSDFHDASMNVQPLPFANMKDDYAMLNGRGYPDTLNPNPLTPPAENGGKLSQVVSSLITADPGQKVLLRISNLNVTRFYTLGISGGLKMKVVGQGARLQRGPDGKDLYYETNSVTLGGGEAVDVLIDTAGTTSGQTYFVYTTNLNYLSNNNEDFGGMMTEIRIN